MAARLVDIAVLDASTAPLLAPYTSVRERDLSRLAEGDGDHGLFVAEGEVVVRVLATRGRFRVRSLLLEARRVAAMRDVLERLPESVPAYVVPQAVMDGVVGFPIHRGILAVGERGAPLRPEDLLSESPVLSAPENGDLANDGDPRSRLARPSSNLVVGLVGLANHDNVGSVFRNAAAFGARGVLLDDESCDPLYRKSIRVSVGAALAVPFARCVSGEAMLDVLEKQGWEPIALTPRADVAIDQLPRGGRRALVLGTEGRGLPEAILRRARPVRIDMEPTLDSLNVAVASGIALYEASRGAR